MSVRKFAFVPGEYYHIYNRGNSKQKIFFDVQDYHRFLQLLYVSNSIQSFKLFFIKDPLKNFERGELQVGIGAYCLMPNHFHILLTPINEHGVRKFMQKLTTGYSMYFNNKYERTGTLFEGKFKAEHVSNDIYLKYLYAYIHLNPVKLIDSEWKEKGIQDQVKARRYIETYEYSSFQDYLSKSRQENKILQKELFPNYFDSKKQMAADIFSWFDTERTKQARPV